MTLPLTSTTAAADAYEPSVQPPDSLFPFGVLAGRGRVQVLAGESWLASVMALHARVREEMPDADKGFLLPKPVQYFRDLLTGRSGVLLGAVVGGQLAGIVAVVQAPCFSVAKMRGLVTYPDEHQAIENACGVDDVAVIQSLCVLRDWAGQSFSRVLIRAAGLWADKQDIPHVFAQVAEKNSPCWLRFMEQDCALIARWTHGHARFLVQKLSPKAKQKKLLRAAPDHHVQTSSAYAQMVSDLMPLSERLDGGGCILLDARPGAGAEGTKTFVYTP